MLDVADGDGLDGGPQGFTEAAMELGYVEKVRGEQTRDRSTAEGDPPASLRRGLKRGLQYTHNYNRMTVR